MTCRIDPQAHVLVALLDTLSGSGRRRTAFRRHCVLATGWRFAAARGEGASDRCLLAVAVAEPFTVSNRSGAGIAVTGLTHGPDSPEYRNGGLFETPACCVPKTPRLCADLQVGDDLSSNGAR